MKKNLIKTFVFSLYIASITSVFAIQWSNFSQVKERAYQIKLVESKTDIDIQDHVNLQELLSQKNSTYIDI
ncbi:MAG: hypothetical protein H7A32_02350 [Deltaproteobacteria bacterium]|nr:hypothetical protein [Deltaproteobacteria bacterium]